jgi:hypothetical protein
LQWGAGMTIPLDPRFHPPLPPESSHGDRHGRWRRLSTFVMALGAGATFALVWGGAGREAASSSWEAVLPGYLLIAGLVWTGALLNGWRHTKVRREVERGWELLQAGRPAEALPFLEAGVHDTDRRLRARSLYGLSLARLRQGDYERALSYGHAASRVGSTRTLIPDTRAPALVATLHALRGDLEAARAWGVAIRRPMFDRTDYALLAQAVMLCRNGWYLEAVKRIQGTTLDNIPEMDVGAVRVLHAFARGRLGGQPLPLKPGCALPETHARASEYGYLAREWPELAAFLRGEDVPALAHGA